MSVGEAVGAAASIFDSVMVLARELQARLRNIENEGRRRAEERAVNLKQKEFSNDH